jgi:hypothetical protein
MNPRFEDLPLDFLRDESGRSSGPHRWLPERMAEGLAMLDLAARLPRRVRAALPGATSGLGPHLDSGSEAQRLDPQGAEED